MNDYIPKPEPRSLGEGKPRLVGVLGKAGSGKDTLADYLKLHPKVWIRKEALAHRVKSAAAEALNLDINLFYDREVKEIPIPKLGLSPRKIAQLVGTELFRNMLGQWVWVATLHKILQESHYVGEAYVITDIRFANEVQWVLEQDGILVYLEREDAAAVEAHSSENIPDLEYVHEMHGLYGGDVIHIQNNGSLQDLYAAIEAQLVPLLLPA